MPADRELTVEARVGQRPPQSGGELAMVGLAALVLIAALVIVGSRWLQQDATADASPSASPGVHVTPLPTGRPLPTAIPRVLGELTLLAGTPPAEAASPEYFGGWIRAKADVTVRNGPSDDASSSWVLAAGQLASVYSEGDPDWLRVQDPQPGGYIHVSTTDTATIQPISGPPSVASGNIWSLSATQDGFVGTATRRSRSDVQAPELVIASSDGSHWTAALAGTRPYGAYPTGPAGMLGYSVQQTGSLGPRSAADPVTIWLWTSTDALHWSVLGAWVDPTNESRPVRQFVGSRLGYLMVFGNGVNSDGNRLWFSADGVYWQETNGTGVPARDDAQITATDHGFYAWTPYRTVGLTSRAFSSDGRHWTTLDSGPDGATFRPAAIADGLLGLDRDPVTGSARVWIGSISGDGFAWQRQPGADAAFADAVVTALVSDGKVAHAFGWDLLTERALVWKGDGRQWRRSAMPATFGGFPRLAAAGPAGVVVVGDRTTAAGPNPVIWRETAAGSWAPETSPLLALVPDPTGGDCPPPPRDAIGFLLMDRPLAVACFGDDPITFRAWSSPCDGCYSDQRSRREPAWLAEPAQDQLYLAPIATSNSYQQAVLAPSLTLDPAWTANWLEVTGHFDDPAAATCRWAPLPEEFEWYEGRHTFLDGCRQTFVVTAVRVVEGP